MLVTPQLTEFQKGQGRSSTPRSGWESFTATRQLANPDVSRIHGKDSVGDEFVVIIFLASQLICQPPVTSITSLAFKPDIGGTILPKDKTSFPYELINTKKNCHKKREN